MSELETIPNMLTLDDSETNQMSPVKSDAASSSSQSKGRRKSEVVPTRYRSDSEDESILLHDEEDLKESPKGVPSKTRISIVSSTKRRGRPPKANTPQVTPQVKKRGRPSKITKESAENPDEKENLSPQRAKHFKADEEHGSSPIRLNDEDSSGKNLPGMEFEESEDGETQEENTLSSDQEYDQKTSVPTPGKRGRPKKVVTDNDQIIAKPTPGKRGRPKKIVTDDDQNNARPTPGKRGRKKKVVTDDEQINSKLTPGKRGRPKKQEAELSISSESMDKYEDENEVNKASSSDQDMSALESSQADKSQDVSKTTPVKKRGRPKKEVANEGSESMYSTEESESEDEIDEEKADKITPRTSRAPAKDVIDKSQSESESEEEEATAPKPKRGRPKKGGDDSEEVGMSKMAQEILSKIEINKDDNFASVLNIPINKKTSGTSKSQAFLIIKL